MKKSHKKTPIIILFAVVAIIILGFRMTNLQNQLDTYESEKTEIANLLFSGSRIKGYSCGILTPSRAKDILATKKLNQAYAQGPSSQIQPHSIKQESIFWSDNCRYEDANNNAKYVELYVTTFHSDEAARRALPEFLGKVNDAVELPAEQFGDELFYDGGAYYLLVENRVIQVAASNGNPTEINEFSKYVFDIVWSFF
jgi:hypothetical protein